MTGDVVMTMKMKRVLLITMFIVITAVIIVICVNLFTGNQIQEYDGTLVKSSLYNWGIL